MKSLELVEKVLKRGFSTRKNIQEVTKLSQATVSRCLKRIENELLVLPNTTPKQFALPELKFGRSDTYSLYEVDEHGKESYLGDLYTLADGKFFVSLIKSASSLYLGENKQGLFSDLPYFLDDLRPQGFLGNLLVKQLAELTSEYPKNLVSWNSGHILKYLVEFGEDLPGNIKFSDDVFKAIKQLLSPIKTDSYDFICKQIETGSVPKSSAAGEQQKFTAFNEEINAHVLVKFSSNKNDAVTRRWKDILVTEFHALKTLSKFNIPAAQVRLIDEDNRFYLETTRFDRLGLYGRSSMISLQSIDMEFTGLGENWTNIAEEISKKNLIVESDRYYINFLWDFSQWIGNTDTHLGNISFGIKGEHFSLLPIYDMCSMSMAPNINRLDSLKIRTPNPKAFRLLIDLGQNRMKILKAAVKLFWQEVVADERISDEFNDYLNNNKSIKEILTL